MGAEFIRPEAIDRVPRISTYYKEKQFRQLIGILKFVGGSQLVDRFKNTCFGHLVDWNPGYKCLPALQHVASRLIHVDDGELWFFIRGNRVKFSVRDFALITGLNFGETDFDSTANYDISSVISHRHFCTTQMTVSDLVRRVTDTSKIVDDPSGNLYLEAVLVCVAHTLIFGSDRVIDKWVWYLVQNLQDFNKFPWGAYAYKLFYHHMRTGGRGSKWHMYGPSWALMIWALEVIPGLGYEVGQCIGGSMIYPRCLRWRFRGRPRNAVIRLAQLFEMVGDVMEIIPDTVELEKSYWVTATGENALRIRFSPPQNPLSYTRHSGNKKSKGANHHTPQEFIEHARKNIEQQMKIIIDEFQGRINNSFEKWLNSLSHNCGKEHQQIMLKHHAHENGDTEEVQNHSTTEMRMACSSRHDYGSNLASKQRKLDHPQAMTLSGNNLLEHAPPLHTGQSDDAKTSKPKEERPNKKCLNMQPALNMKEWFTEDGNKSLRGRKNEEVTVQELDLNVELIDTSDV